MTPDEIIEEIFRIQSEREPHADPGDIQITIQDDMPMVVVNQPTRKRPWWDQGIPGGTVQQALELYLEEVKNA